MPTWGIAPSTPPIPLGTLACRAPFLLAYLLRVTEAEHLLQGVSRVATRVESVETRHDVRHVVAGDRGLSEWVFAGTTPDGRAVRVHGCDVFTFREGKIAVKSSFLKSRTA